MSLDHVLPLLSIAVESDDFVASFLKLLRDRISASKDSIDNFRWLSAFFFWSFRTLHRKSNQSPALKRIAETRLGLCWFLLSLCRYSSSVSSGNRQSCAVSCNCWRDYCQWFWSRRHSNSFIFKRFLWYLTKHPEWTSIIRRELFSVHPRK